MNLNERAYRLVERLQSDWQMLGVTRGEGDCEVWDFGVQAPGGLEAGVRLAEICTAGLASIDLFPATHAWGTGLDVSVRTDQPLLACMASQYAGWEVKGDDYFAMGSGPMRAAAAREDLFSELGYREETNSCVGVLEAGQLPPDAVCKKLAEQLGIEPSGLALLVAPTRSLAGSVQIVARSVETALHKLHVLDFDLKTIASAHGVAPLHSPADNDLTALGRTNDAILYGGRVTLFVRTTDEQISEVGPRVPSSASPDHGRPFGEIFAAYEHDFYKVDPLLFSPAEVTFCNLNTGRTQTFGACDFEVLKASP